ncbi:hypothetical protein ACVWZZ_004289 [Bradyrhizobium sp. LM6.10]
MQAVDGLQILFGDNQQLFPVALSCLKLSARREEATSVGAGATDVLPG